MENIIKLRSALYQAQAIYNAVWENLKDVTKPSMLDMAVLIKASDVLDVAMFAYNEVI